MAEAVTLSERMVRLETQLDWISKWQEELKALVVQSNKDNDMKYASKTTESIVYAEVWIILTAFVLALVALIFKKKQ